MSIRFLLEGGASGGTVEVFEFDVPAGAKLPAGHSHDGYEETIYGLEGVLEWTVEGTPIDVGVGEVLCIPRGAVHLAVDFRAVTCDGKFMADPREAPFGAVGLADVVVVPVSDLR